MKADKLSDAIGLVDEDLVVEAQRGRRVLKRGRRWWVQWVAVAACLCLVIGGVLTLPRVEPQQPEASIPPAESIGQQEAPVRVLAEAVYPDENAQAPSRIEFMELKIGEGMSVFYETVMQQFLAGKPGENRVFSPLNVYMALAVLAETTDGEGREEILTLLGVKDMDALRLKANRLWEQNYEYDQLPDYEFGDLQLANSLWMKDGLSYNEDVFKTLAEQYYASSFSGEMGSQTYNNKLRDWLNEQTGGLLQDQVAGVELNPNTVLSLVSTIYFGAKWVNTFDPTKTYDDVFHASAGDVTVPFMHQNDFSTAYVGKECKAISLPLGSGYRMVLVLPNEGVTVDAFLASQEWSDGVLGKNAIFKERPSYWDIQISLPKFDISGDVDLSDGLKALGVHSIFDSATADFSPILADAAGVAVTSMKHAARVTIDEEGCTAAAFSKTDMGMGSPVSNGVLEMNFNRPFVFAITGTMDDILFAGVVEQP